MKRAFLGASLLALAILPLGACQTTTTQQKTAVIGAAIGAASASSPKVAAAVNKVDASIQSATAKVAQYCADAKLALAVGGLFTSNAKTQAALAVAKTTVSNFCDAPPADMISAATLMEGAVGDLKSAGLI